VQLEVAVEVFVVHACIFKAKLLPPPCGKRAPGGLAGSVRRRPGAGAGGPRAPEDTLGDISLPSTRASCRRGTCSEMGASERVAMENAVKTGQRRTTLLIAL